MRKGLTIISFALAFLVGVSAYVFYSFSRQAVQSKPQDSEIAVPETILQAPTTPQDRDLSSTPLPPPATGNLVQSPAEPTRTLVGSTPEQIRQIEESLPRESQIYLSPVDGNRLVPALVQADLDADESPEVVVVHTKKPSTPDEPTPPLSLSVLERRDGKLILRTSADLVGGVLFNIQMNGSPVPLAVSDLTGDGYREIVVASGMGASLGGELQVFRFQENSLVAISTIGGNVFRLQTLAGKSVIITAESRYENKPRSYRWNGHRFVKGA